MVAVSGTALSCGGKTIEGSGFVYAKERVMTTAHGVTSVENATSPDIYRKTRVTREVFALQDVEISPGQSGAPVISADGRVAGMVFAAATAQERVAFGLTAHVLAGPAQQGAAATESVSTQTCD